LKDASRQVADVIGNYTPNGRAHVVGLSLGGAVAVRMLLDGPEVLEHVMISGQRVLTHFLPVSIR
jgi:pimeloyl-ACP methyl ester carboxylesterase